MMGGYSLETKPNSTIGGELYIGGGQVLLAGNIASNAYIGTAALELQGTIGGDVQVEVGPADNAQPFNPFQYMPDAPPVPAVPAGLIIGDGASIGGDLSYSSPQEFAVPGRCRSRYRPI